MFTRRQFEGAADLLRMRDLILTFPDDNLHVVDLPYRLAWPERCWRTPSPACAPVAPRGRSSKSVSRAPPRDTSTSRSDFAAPTKFGCTREF